MQNIKKKAKKSQPKLTNAIFKFIVSASLIILGFFLFLSLLTYDPFDPSPLSVTGIDEKPSNALGLLGSYSSSLLFATLGHASWFLVFFSFGFCRIYIGLDKLDNIFSILLSSKIPK